MWELDCEEGWAPKNWCFWTVVLEKTLESPLDCKEIQSVHSKGDQPWDFFGRNDAKADTPVLWPPHAELTHWKRLWCWEGLGAGGEGDDRGWDAGWHQWLDGRKSEWTLGAGDGHGGLACCDSWGRKESDTTEQLNWTELNTTQYALITFHRWLHCISGTRFLEKESISLYSIQHSVCSLDVHTHAHEAHTRSYTDTPNLTPALKQ